jgi:hypothetical protein
MFGAGDSGAGFTYLEAMMYAIITNHEEKVISKIRIKDGEPADCDFYAEVHRKRYNPHNPHDGGCVPFGCGDFTVTLHGHSVMAQSYCYEAD